MKTRSSKRSAEGKFVLPTDHHGLLGAATLSGAVAGATTGALAGPPGMIAGGVIGVAVGTLAGMVLEKDERATEEHDGELDETIGVSGGDMGARDSAHDGLDAYEQAREDDRLQREEEELALSAELDAAPTSANWR